MKRLNILTIAAAAMIGAVSCGGNAVNNTSSASNGDNKKVSMLSVASAPSANDAKVETDGSTYYTYGNHRYEVKGDFKTDKITTSDFNEVTFTNIPADYTEFEKVYKEFLGKHINGTAAMMVMAMEMYGRNKSVGERCIRLINTPNNVSSVMNILKDRYGNYTSDGYSQRYIAAALLDGAVRTNSYTPTEPYTVKCQGSPNGIKQMTMPKYGTVYYMYVIGGGWDTHQRQCEIVMFEDDEDTGLYHMNNCPSFYTQCQQIKGEWKGLK